jgi:hypothetical protein
MKAVQEKLTNPLDTLLDAGESTDLGKEQLISTWSPLRHSLFRALWTVAVASNTGTWMHNIGVEWLMTA